MVKRIAILPFPCAVLSAAPGLVPAPLHGLEAAEVVARAGKTPIGRAGDAAVDAGVRARGLDRAALSRGPMPTDEQLRRTVRTIAEYNVFAYRHVSIIDSGAGFTPEQASALVDYVYLAQNRPYRLGHCLLRYEREGLWWTDLHHRFETIRRGKAKLPPLESLGWRLP
jgi:hypothetical protein